MFQQHAYINVFTSLIKSNYIPTCFWVAATTNIKEGPTPQAKTPLL